MSKVNTIKTVKERFLLIFFLILFFIHTIRIVYAQRSYFLEPYDISYWKDRFEHSQWQLPLSKRIIGDDGLFAYVGHQLIQGGNPAGVNAETPPVGKYLIGLSILLLNNPSYYAFFTGIGSLGLFFLVTQKIIKKTIPSLAATLLLFFDPLFFTQLWKSWLDIAQLFFLLLHIALIFSISRTTNLRSTLYLLLSGLALGFFTQTKLPILLPLIITLDLIWLVYKKYVTIIPVFIGGFIVGILLPYVKFFLLGNNLLDFIRLEKYIASFYLKSYLVAHKEAIWKVLLTGSFPDIVSGVTIKLDEWTIIWPVITVIGIFFSIKSLIDKKNPLTLKLIAIFILCSLIIYTNIPFYPRYLTIVLPFLYLVSAYFISKIKEKKLATIAISLIMLYVFFYSSNSLMSSLDLRLKSFYYNFSNEYFQDLYQEDMSQKHSLDLSRQDFFTLAKINLDNASVKSIDIFEEGRNIFAFGDEGSVKLKIIYKTERLGAFVENKTIPLVKERGQWKVKWKWDLLLNSFSPSFYTETKIISGKRGTIKSAAGEILAQDTEGYLIKIRPDKINRQKENQMLNDIGMLSSTKPVHIQNAYLENALSYTYTPIATVYSSLTDKEKQRLLSYSGVKLVPYSSRAYTSLSALSIKNTLYDECCTRIYSSYNYHGISGPEKQYDDLLAGYDGGEILIKNQKGKVTRVILKKEAKMGNDVEVSL